MRFDSKAEIVHPGIWKVFEAQVECLRRIRQVEKQSQWVLLDKIGRNLSLIIDQLDKDKIGKASTFEALVILKDDLNKLKATLIESRLGVSIDEFDGRR